MNKRTAEFIIAFAVIGLSCFAIGLFVGLPASPTCHILEYVAITNPVAGTNHTIYIEYNPLQLQQDVGYNQSYLNAVICG